MFRVHAQDPDFLAIEDSQERRDLFKEYVSDLARANEEREKRERQKKIDAFIELLKEVSSPVLPLSASIKGQQRACSRTLSRLNPVGQK